MEDQEMRKVKCKRYLKYTFTRDEKEAISDSLARNISDLKQKQLAKKEVVKSLDSEIAAFETEVSNLATKVKDGYEYRNIDCEMVFDIETRMKTVYRMDDETVVERLPMTADELQQDLGFTS